MHEKGKRYNWSLHKVLKCWLWHVASCWPGGGNHATLATKAATFSHLCSYSQRHTLYTRSQLYHTHKCRYYTIHHGERLPPTYVSTYCHPSCYFLCQWRHLDREEGAVPTWHLALALDTCVYHTCVLDTVHWTLDTCTDWTLVSTTPVRLPLSKPWPLLELIIARIAFALRAWSKFLTRKYWDMF